MTSLQDLVPIVLIGLGATAVMDLWLALLRRLGVPSLDMAYLGRWAGHLLRGRVAHAAIGRAPPVAGERAWGWLLHYAVGVAFAALLVALRGPAWIGQPTLLPALAVGLATVLAPLCVMQPAMGAGFASSRTPTPLRNCLRSVANHAVFGLGLYLSAVTVASLAP
ncbi:MAG: DUF2938 domain-containing protein [Piscinibacter sp.]|nr:DUF2938 domain-containing protein [Piscinibacter sp.]